MAHSKSAEHADELLDRHVKQRSDFRCCQPSGVRVVDLRYHRGAPLMSVSRICPLALLRLGQSALCCLGYVPIRPGCPEQLAALGAEAVVMRRLPAFRTQAHYALRRNRCREIGSIARAW